VAVQVKGTTFGAATDLDGRFSVNVPAEYDVLLFSYVGYRPQEITIGNQTSFEVLLVQDILGLDDLVVVGYGTQQRREITGAIASVPMEQIREIPSSSFENAILGRLA